MRSSDLRGSYLKRDLYNHHGLLIASASTRLDAEQIRIIQLHGIAIDEQDVLELSGRAIVQGLMDEGADVMQEMFHDIRSTGRISMMDIHREIVPSIQRMTEKPDFFELFASLQSKDDYIYRHNIAVGVLSTLIGRWLRLSESELTLLTIAATLHDIGKVKIPLDILNKPGKLTDEEYEVIRQHTMIGYDMLTGTIGINHQQALVALQHHERIDGRGYPYGLTKNRITYFSRIVAVADVFHAMTSDRTYHKALPLYETLRQMNNSVFGELDPRICTLFIHKMMQAMIGNHVVLSNGEVGKIVMTHPYAPLRPLVQCDARRFLDLNKLPDLQIMNVFLP